MKKKLLTLFFASSLVLGACGEDTDTPEEDTATDDVESVEEETPAEEDTAESDDNQELVGSTFEDDENIYRFLEVEQMPGEMIAEQIIAITIEYTNKSDEPQNPWMALNILAKQETENTVEVLMGANGEYPEDYKPEAVKMGDADIKPDTTVEAVIGYELETPGAPVFFEHAFDNTEFNKTIETNDLD